VLAAILLAALLLRLLYPQAVGLPERTPMHGFVIDEQEYYGAASVLADGRGLHFYDTFTWTRTPAYVLLVGSLFVLLGRDTGPVFILQALLSTLTLWGLAALAGREAARAPALGLSPRSAMRWAALTGAVWLPFTLFSNLLVSETLFLLLIVGAFLLLERWADSTHPSLLLAAGILLGLAALTRSTTLAFLPLAAGWAGWVAWRAGAVRRWAVAPVALLVAAGLTLLPAVVANYADYGRLIIGDTTGGYNLWLAANGVRDAERLSADLAAIPNPADKQSYAYSQAFEEIAARPADFVGKGLKESLDLWKINFSSEERQVRGFAEGRVPALHLWSLFVGEDLLYVIIVPLALLGLAAAPPHPIKLLLALWALTWVVMAFVFFAVTRFRFPVVSLLLPWVPLGLATLLRLSSRLSAPVPPASRRPPAPVKTQNSPLVLAALFLLAVAPDLPNDLSVTLLGAQKWEAQAPYRDAAQNPDAVEALTLLAKADQSVPDTLFARDAAEIRTAQDDAGLLAVEARPEVSLARGSPLAERFEPFLLSGEIARRLGQESASRTVFGSRQIHDADAEAVDWAWQFLHPDPQARLDVGGDLDFGALRGFHKSEAVGQGSGRVTYRWSGPESTMRIQSPSETHALVIRWSGARPPGVPPAVVTARVTYDAGLHYEHSFTLPTTDTWREDTIWNFTLKGGAGAALHITTNTFVPGGFDPRVLGVRVDWVELR